MESKRLTLSPSVKFGFALFVVALILRLVGMSWGLPGEWRVTTLHPDEPVNLAATYAARDLTPNFYNYGTFFFTVNNLFFGLLHLLGLGNPDPNGGTLGGLVQEYWTGRFVSALAGAGMVWVTFAYLFKRVNWVGALAGATAVTVAPGLVVHSRFMTVDLLASLWVLLSLYFAAEAVDGKGQRAFLWAGVFAGLAAGTKYSGILALVALAPVLWTDKSSDRWKHLGMAALASVVTFLVAVPGVLLETEAFRRDFLYELGHVAGGHGLVFVGTSSGWVYHWSNLFAALGFLLTALGIVGLGRLVRNRTPWAIGLVLFFVVVFVTLARAEVKFMRYVFPLIPVLAIGFGWLMGRMHENPNKKWQYGVALGMLAIAGMGRGGLVDAVTYTYFMLDADPREKAAQSLKGAESVGLVADPWYYTPSLYPEVAATRAVPFSQREAARMSQTAPRVLRYVPDNPDERMDWDSRLITELNPEFIVFSSFEEEGYDRLARQRSGDEYEQSLGKRYTDFFTILKQRYGGYQVYGRPMLDAHDLRYIQPKVQIWKRKTP